MKEFGRVLRAIALGSDGRGDVDRALHERADGRRLWCVREQVWKRVSWLSRSRPLKQKDTDLDTAARIA